MTARRLPLALAVGLLALAALPAGAQAKAPTVVHTWRVNLDSDPHIERVRLMLALEPNPYGGTVPIQRRWLQVVDRVGGRVVKARITPVVEHMQPRWIHIEDLNARGRPEIFFRGFIGGAGAVPVYAGIRGWNGTSTHRFWSYGPPFPVMMHNGHRYRYVGANVSLVDLAGAATPGLEVHVVQGEALPADADCCPSQLLIRNYRFDLPLRAWTLYQKIWRHS
jgi:hypothetical protein